MRSQRVGRWKGLPTCWTSTAISLTDFIACLPLPWPGPPSYSQVLFIASSTLTRLCSTLQSIAAAGSRKPRHSTIAGLSFKGVLP
eukprot:Skav228934  [mRNA]  locus=scaffold2181:289970:292070:- [translate_table: standard]